MGKKTTKFIAAVQELQTECKTQIENYLNSISETAKLEPLADRMVQQCIERYNELLKQNNNDKEKVAHLLSTDPEYLRREKESDSLGMKLYELKRARSRAKDGLFNALSKLDHKLGEFDKFIAKKQKSKNPFRSKKSLPAAKDFVAASRVFQENTEEYFRSIGGLDFV